MLNPDPLILSFPKCGRTWIRAFFILYERDTGIPINVEYRHTTYKSAPTFKRVLLVREPCDIMVSYYFQAKYRSTKNFKCSDIKEFIRCNHVVEDLSERWEKWQRRKGECLEIKYEDLFNNIWAEILEFLNIEIISEKVNKIHKLCEFDNLKKNIHNYFDNNQNRLVFYPLKGKHLDLHSTNNDAHKFRVGKVGGYVDYLDQDDIDYIRNGVPEAARWYKEYA